MTILLPLLKIPTCAFKKKKFLKAKWKFPENETKIYYNSYHSSLNN